MRNEGIVAKSTQMKNVLYPSQSLITPLSMEGIIMPRLMIPVAKA